MKLINYNGKILSSKDFHLGIDNRCFKYGDGLFESMKFANGQPYLYDLHYKRLQKGMSILKIEADLKFDSEKLLSNIQQTVFQNKIEGTCRIRLSVFRDNGGYYAPENKETSYIIESVKLTKPNLKKSGISLGVYNEIPKPINLLSNLKTCNSLIFVMAGIYKNENGFDDVLILNENRNIVESISSNVFIVFKNEIITPALSEGCVQGVQRDFLIKKIRMQGMVVKEKEVTLNDLKSADEAFLTNAIQGISWVGSFDEKNYKNKITSKLLKMLN